MAEVRQVYRILLRTVRDRISSRNQNSIWHDYIVEEFHRNATEKNPAKVQELLRIAKDYAQLVQGVNYEKVSALTTPDLLSFWQAIALEMSRPQVNIVHSRQVSFV